MFYFSDGATLATPNTWMHFEGLTVSAGAKKLTISKRFVVYTMDQTMSMLSFFSTQINSQ